MSLLVAKRCLVAGHVQGVYFRATARKKALSLGIAGYAHNLDDGSVEVLAIGAPEHVSELTEWLWIGSPAARVASVDVEEIDLALMAKIPTGFTTD